MSFEKKHSDEFLNAFVDDQLAPEEKSRFYLCLHEDEKLARQVCELRQLRDLVQLSYKRPALPAGGLRDDLEGRRRGLNLAAGVLLALGIAVGWMLHQGSGERALNGGAVVAGVPEIKVMLHLNENNPALAMETLDELEAMLQQFRAAGRAARVELVVNGEGLDLLRSETSVAPRRIARMQKDYDNLTFIACKNTIDRFERETGIVAKLLPGVVVIDSGVAQLMRRQHQGWAYIQA